MIRPDDRSPEDRRQDAVADAKAPMSMREKMARAKIGDLFFDMSTAVREAALDNLLPAFEALADAGIDMLLVPTEAMLREGYDSTAGDALSIIEGIMESGESVRSGYVAMMRAAREGK